MSDIEKKKLLAEIYKNFRQDLDHLERERLAFMRQIVRKMEDKKTKDLLTSLRS